MTSPKTVLTRRLGKDGPEIPAVGFGLMGISVGYGKAEYAFSTMTTTNRR